MKKFLLSVAVLISVTACQAQIVSLELETICDGTCPGISSDYKTQRLWANMTSANDMITVVYGVLGSPLYIQTDCCFYNSAVGAPTGDQVNCSFCSFFPDLCYDSWVTIGRACTSDPGAQIYTLNSPGQPWPTIFNGACGGDILMDDIVGGAWFTPTGSSNAMAGADLKILLGQFTHCGNELTININAQVWPNFINNDVSDPIEQTGLSLGSLGGCLDSDACNYNPLAEVDNGQCVYPCDLQLGTPVLTPPSCAGSLNGSVDFSHTGGQGFVRYYMNGQNNLTGVFDNLQNGTYTVTVVDEYFLAGQPGAVACGIVGCQQQTTITFNTAPVTLSGTVSTPASCFGLSDGSHTSSFSGGTAPVSWTLTNNADNATVASGLSSPAYTTFAAGSYHWDAIDANGCTFAFPNFNITQPADLNITINNTFAATCHDTPDGGVQLSWFGGVGDVDYTFQEGGTYLEGNIFLDQFLPGTQTVYGIDANGCTDIDTFTIPGPAALVASGSATMTTCSYEDDACITITSTGGNAGAIQYSLNGVNYQSSNQFCALGAGEYDIYVLDSQGCDDDGSVTVMAPSELQANATATDITCNGFGNGQIITTATGGSPTYTYNIGLGGTTSGLFLGLGPDEYSIVVTDVNACADTVTVVVVEPQEVAVTATTTSALCFGSNDGTVTASASGGVGDFTYELDNTGEQASNEFDGLDADEYTITAVDGNGCAAEVDVEVTEPSQLVLTVTGSTDETGVDLNNGTISVNVSGGTPVYTYEWTDPDGDVVSTQEDPTNLPPGDYTLMVTDANGCERSLATFVNIDEYVGIAELSNGLSIKVSPNPTMGEFTLNMTGLSGEKVSFMITDAQGRLVQEVELGNRSGENLHRVDLTPQSAGVYFLHLFIGEQQTTVKVIKQ